MKSYQDSTNKAGTSNLKKHTEKCFGASTVADVFAGKAPKEKDGSIFAVFSHLGQQPV
jgi:hypothetical protein